MRYLTLLCMSVLWFCGNQLLAQPQDEYTPEMRKKFIADQTAYFEKLNLSDGQKRGYEEITRRYDKQILMINWSELKESDKKKRIKSIEKRKNAEMKNLLASDQFKLYRIRQKEIKNNYN